MAFYEFQIYAVDRDLFVDGRNVGPDLPIGIQFTQVIEGVVTITKESARSEHIRSFPISCRIVDIESYRHRLPSLSHGLSGRVKIEGATYDELVQFVSPPTHHYFSLRSSPKE